MKNTRIGLLPAMLLVCRLAAAQTVEQGKSFLYYERLNSAKETFEKVLAANPNNIEAVYYLGQTLIALKDTTEAKSLYQKMLATNGSAPLLLAGIGEIELFEGNTNDARQRFETAISLTKGKDVSVLNAVARANVDSKAGDLAYAIEKLNLATQTKNFNNTDTYMILGDVYRRQLDGGNAVAAYQKALAINPRLAAAEFKIGVIYYTQNNPEYFLPAYEKAITLDPAYAPAYYELYLYWYYRDVNKASGYLDKYVADADPGPKVEYLRTYFLYGAARFADAKAKAEDLIKQYGNKVDPIMYRMVSYTADTLGDLSAAKDAMTTFLGRADSLEIKGADFEELAKIYSKMPDSASRVQAFPYYRKAIGKDTLQENRSKYLAEATDLAKKINDQAESASLASLLYTSLKNPNQSDLYNWGISNYQAGYYTTADSIFCNLYESKYPTEIYGYLWCSKSKQAEDTTLQSGIVAPAWDKLYQEALTIDSVKYKNLAIQTLFYLAFYYNDIKKDRPTAVTYLQKVLDIDPANADALKFKDMLTKPPPRAKTAPKAGASTHSGNSQ